MKIDLREIVSQIDFNDMPEGKFDLDYDLPDGRSVNIRGCVTIHGYRSFSHNSPDGLGYFRGGIQFSLYDWTGYDQEGNEIPVINTTWFENHIQHLINH